VNGDMDTDPQVIRTRIDTILADLSRPDSERPGSEDAGSDTIDFDAVGHRLEEAHQILVDALESVEKG